MCNVEYMSSITPSLIGQHVSLLDTPSLVIELDTMERNLEKMRHFAASKGVLLRPHAKMHRSSYLARLQVERGGAIGHCVQKVAEAEALAAGGLMDIFISNEVTSPQKIRRIKLLALALHKAGGGLAVAADSVEGVGLLAAPFLDGDIYPQGVLRVLVEIDVGQRRCGCTPGSSVIPIVQAIGKCPAMRFGGLHAYHGSAQHTRSYEERKAIIASVVCDVQKTVECLQAAGYPIPLVTGAGTGTFSLEASSGVYGEVQPGSYLTMDKDYAINAPHDDHPSFENALFVKTTVMSTRAGQSVVDAGHKSHAVDTGLPGVVGHPEIEFVNGGDEHGILRAADPGVHLPRLNETVWLIPNHCDPTFNLYARAYGVRGGIHDGTIESIIDIDARGCST